MRKDTRTVNNTKHTTMGAGLIAAVITAMGWLAYNLYVLMASL